MVPNAATHGMPNAYGGMASGMMSGGSGGVGPYPMYSSTSNVDNFAQNKYVDNYQSSFLSSILKSFY